MFIATAVATSSDPVTHAWMEFVGHLHPLMLHFPLALLLIGTAAVVWNWFRGEEGVGEFAFHCLWIGAAMAVLASVSGWFFAEDEGSGKGLELHRWFAVASTGAAVLLAALASLSRTDERPGLVAATRLLALITAGAMAFTGHVGGEMVWGEGVVTDKFVNAIKVSWSNAGSGETEAAKEAPKSSDPTAAKPAAASGSGDTAKPQEAPKSADAPKAPDAAKPAETPATTPAETPKPSVSMGAVAEDAFHGDALAWGEDPPKPSEGAKPSDGSKPADSPASPPKSSDPKATPPASSVPPPVPPTKPVSWKDDVLPLLKDKCFECHSGEKPKDGVAFDHMPELIKTEGKRAVVMKGEPSKSTMFGSIMKPDNSKKRMPPPKKGPRLTPEQVGIIEAWIKEGAKLDN